HFAILPFCHFANQEILAPVLGQLLEEFGIGITESQGRHTSSDNLSTDSDGHLQLHVHHEADLDWLMQESGTTQLDPDASHIAVDFALRILTDDVAGKVTPTLLSPVAVDYQIKHL
ncbi:hypothetical protein, partial [Algicola sagamiensis]|uniref:hypothetical protein n=1 Tax=Algicola sagamiensis TaxID=163869 RepID=UPI00058FBC66